MIEIKVAETARGSAWLLEGFDYFKKDAGVWLGITVILFILSIITTMIPLGGLMFQIIMPIFVAGLILGCREIDNGREFGINYLFSGFSNNSGALLMVGVLYFLGVIAIVLLLLVLAFILFGGMDFFNRLSTGDVGTLVENIKNILLIILLGSALYLPLLMALWFAPVLVVLEGQGAIAAMLTSFKGCLVNTLPFLLYGLLGLVFAIIASIPLMLGWLILFPMLIASIYIAYKDIFRNISA